MVDVQQVVNFVEAQPFFPALPFIGAVALDWALGSYLAFKENVFAKEQVFDWVKTTVGWKQAAAITGAVALVFLTRGQSDATATVLADTAVGGVAFVVVMDDVREKVSNLVQLFTAKPPIAPVAPTPTVP